MGRVKHSIGITDPSTLFAGKSGLEKAKKLVTDYKTGKVQEMSPELWRAKKIVDSTLHAGKHEKDREDVEGGEGESAGLISC